MTISDLHHYGPQLPRSSHPAFQNFPEERLPSVLQLPTSPYCSSSGDPPAILDRFSASKLGGGRASGDHARYLGAELGDLGT
jgi:hypothetical protein